MSLEKKDDETAKKILEELLKNDRNYHELKTTGEQNSITRSEQDAALKKKL